LESESSEREKTSNSKNNPNNNSNNKESEKENNPLPDYINFVIILDYSFPKSLPKILLKTSVKLKKLNFIKYYNKKIV